MQSLQKEKRSVQKAVRNPNLDLIRCIAVLNVISVHFFANTGFYMTTVSGTTMVAATILRTACMTCVPLFVLLTGYLCSTKKLVPSYFKKIIPLLATYVIICIMGLTALVVVRDLDYTLLDGVLQILAITNGAIGYAWYVEMYIGLFLLIPFLNRLYQSMTSRKEKKMLLGVLLLLTMVPIELNYLDYWMPEFFERFCNVAHFQEIIPSSWTAIWPVTFYFLGVCLREKKITVKPWKLAVLFLLSITLFGLLECHYSWGRHFLWINGSEWCGLQNTVNGVLLFLLVLNLDLSRLPGWVTGLLNRVSVLSFGIYLCSFFSDEIVYKLFGRWEAPFEKRFFFFPLCVLASFLTAAVLSQAAEWIRSGIFWSVEKLQEIRHSQRQ